MPTGYTEDIYNGQEVSFEDFVWKCVRNMGYAHRHRDSGELPDDPGDYSEEIERLKGELQRCQYEVDQYEAMGWHAAEKAAQEEFEEELRRWETARAEQLARKSRYETMLKRVHEWEVPTPEHASLKTFMIDQLEESLRWDCSLTENGYREFAPKLKSWDVWLQERLESARENRDYYAKNLGNLEQHQEKARRYFVELERSVPRPKR